MMDVRWRKTPQTAFDVLDEVNKQQQDSAENRHDYGSAAAYADAVRAWIFAQQSIQFGQCLGPFLAFSSLNQNQQTNQISPVPQVDQNQNQNQPAPEVRDNEFTSATYCRRFAAEMIDATFGFIFKLFFTYLLLEFGIIQLDRYEKLLLGDSDLRTFVDIMHELFPYEMLCKLIICLIEAFYLSYGVGTIPPGSSPGKFVMNIKVIRCDLVTGLGTGDRRIIVYRPDRIGFLRAFGRTLIKNFAVAFMFPLCLTMFFGRYNRTMYDVACGTVVVDGPPRRRRPN